MKLRLDKLLVQRGLVASRERAQALILAGRVLVDEQKSEKAGASVEENAAIRLLGNDLPYVSRGGLKLAHALEHWHIDVRNKTCMDVGASTGGFTDCLLQNGASQIIAIDTGYGQMDAKLRADPRVRLLERTNARYLTAEQIAPLMNDEGTYTEEQRYAIALVAMDVSFISATLVLPAIVASAIEERTAAQLSLIVLVKPQFESARKDVGKGGIVRDPEVQQAAVKRVIACVQQLGGCDIEVIDSPILGTEGNREFLLYARIVREPGELPAPRALH